jgi:hypothetical protein
MVGALIVATLILRFNASIDGLQAYLLLRKTHMAKPKRRKSR